MTTISIQCTHCLKRYNAPASMAGKRVKCKHCGEIFAIPADAADGPEPLPVDAPAAPLPRIAPLPKQGSRKAPVADDAGAPDAEDETRPNPAIRAIGSGAGKLKAPTSDEDEPPAKIGDPRHGIAARVTRSADVRELDVAGDRPAAVVSVRPSVPWDFPGADPLDRFVPPVLAVSGLAWLGYMAAGAHPEGVAWPGMLKLGVYLALFFVVGLPMGYAAVAWAARRRRFAMARPALWRALGAFAFPFALALILWLVGGSGGMLIVGTILGAALACGAVWFLFRIQPQEVGTALGATAVGFSLSIAVSYVLMWVVSLIVAATARSSGTNRLAESPVGPTFAWDVPVATDEPRGKGTPTINVPTTSGSETPMVVTGVGAALAAESTSGAVEGVEASVPPDGGTGAMATAAARQVAGAVAAAGRTGASEGVAARAVAAGVEPTTTTKPAAAVEAAVEPASPLVASVKVLDVGPFDSLLFPQGGQAGQGGAPVVATVRAVGDSDQIDLWALNPPQRKAQATIRREKSGGYALSPSGEWLAHVVAWPSVKAKMWSFAAGQDVKTKDVELTAANGTPAVLGFGAGDSLVIHWTAGEGKVGFEVFGTREPAGRLIADAVVDAYEPGSGNPSIQPDGRQIAFAAVTDTVGGINLWDLTARRKKAAATLKVPLSKWVRPTGMAFSPDGRQIAAYFEHEGRGLVTVHTVAPPGKLVHQHQYAEAPVPILAAQAAGPGSRTFDWVDHQTLLLYGSVLVDAESGQPLGSLGIDRVRTQAVIDRETVLVHAKGKDGEADRVLLIKLKGDEVE
ncbi:MAG: hypothetical protein ACAI43_06225, partial [Phycisphaerae bacterium]